MHRPGLGTVSFDDIDDYPSHRTLALRRGPRWPATPGRRVGRHPGV